VPTPIVIRVGSLELRGELGDGPLARAVAAALPLEATVRRFGQAAYVETPMDEALGPSASDQVEVGDIAYWPPALAVVLFFGPTPASAPGSARPVAASEVEVIGRFEQPERLREGRLDGRMRIERGWR
jgi:hypothetical protein